MVAGVKTTSEEQQVATHEKVRGALLGLAFGDALGWPFEGRAKRASSLPPTGPATELFAWIKRGGRFQPDEPIGLGEYSDDTQLTLATARSVLLSERHWERFAFCELPTWLFYERGGGRATKAAARGLAAGVTPWESKKTDEVRSYFQAGGNGAAMRVLPLAVLHSGDSLFEHLARDVMANAVSTHGHPRALLGALATAYLQWFALRLDRTLEYGELVDALLDKLHDWSPLPNVDSSWSAWLQRAELSSPKYESLWRDVAAELHHLLEEIRKSLKAGALVLDSDVLASIGALNRSTNGSGTVCAAAAAYIASRYAASPRSAVTAAATAKGADTDTLASMVGSILGCLVGDDWLGYSALALQDRQYLIETAGKLSSGVFSRADWRRVSERDIKALRRLIESAPTDVVVELPDGRRGVAKEPHEISSSIIMRRVSLDDGQSFLLSVKGLKEYKPLPKTAVNLTHSRVRIDVVDVPRSANFYNNVLGLPIIRRSEKLVVFDSFAIRAVPEQCEDLVNNVFTIVIEVADLNAVREQLQRASVVFDQDQHGQGKRKSYRVRDPDGYRVEIVESL
jgi:ADP-ribosylglycohydrolase/catechol 2,3-dioxygenase-like lactoylglutathione lyase family enzyme